MTVVTRSFVRILAEVATQQRLAKLAGETPITIDYFASRRCGATIGDIRVRVGVRGSDATLVELEPIGPVRVLAERRLVPLLADGATIRLGGSFRSSLSIELDHPDAWLIFLEHHPESRR